MRDWDWVGIFFGSVTVVAVAAMAILIIFIIVDVVHNGKPAHGVISDLQYRPGHYETRYFMAGKVMIPMSSWRDDEYLITITNDDGTQSTRSTDAENFPLWKKGRRWDEPDKK